MSDEGPVERMKEILARVDPDALDEGVTRFWEFRLLVASEETIESDLERYAEGGFDGVSCPGVLLSRFPDVGFASVTIRNDADRLTLEQQTHLTRIQVEGPNERAVPVDLSRFEGLRLLALSWHPSCVLPRSLPQLERLYVSDYAATTVESFPEDLPSLRLLWLTTTGATKSMPRLPRAEQVEHLAYGYGRVPALAGLERVPNVRVLDIRNLGLLTDISEVAGLGQLEEVMFDDCRRLTDLSPLGRCPNLRALSICGSPKVESIGFIRSCTKFDDFHCWDTTILDGDLTPLIGVEKVSLEHKRRYSHTESQLRELTARVRRGESIDVPPPPAPAPRPATGGPPPLPTAEWLEDLPEGFPRKGVQALNVRLQRFVEDMAPLPKNAPVSHVLYRVKWVVKDIGLINDHYDEFLDTGAREELVDFIHDMVADYEVGTWGDDLTERWRRW